MGGVDNLDKDKCIGGSFTGRAMFKKWYRMGLMGIFDFMIVNGRQAWNMSTKLPYHGNRYPLTKAYFCIALAEELLRFKDESAVNFLSEARFMIASSHVMTTPQRAKQMGCCVCQLEKQFVLASKKALDRMILIIVIIRFGILWHAQKKVAIYMHTLFEVVVTD